MVLTSDAGLQLFNKGVTSAVEPLFGLFDAGLLGGRSDGAGPASPELVSGLGFSFVVAFVEIEGQLDTKLEEDTIADTSSE